MSLFVNLESIKQTRTNRVETPKFILDESMKNAKEIAISVQYIVKPPTEACCAHEAQWAITKDVYHIELDDESDKLGSQIPRQEEERVYFRKENKFRSFLHKTPIAVLFSESKNGDQEPIKQQAKLPLYSSQCKLDISIYAIENQNDKFGLQNSRTLLRPDVRFQLGRDQLLQMIRELKNRPADSRMLNSRLQKNDNQLIKKFDDYEIRLKKIGNNQDIFSNSRNSLLSKPNHDNYACTLEHQMKIGRRFHLIEFCFILSVQKFQECVGYLRAGFAKKVNFGQSDIRLSYNNNERLANRLSDMSQYSIEDKKQRNFNFNLDFSGLKTKDNSRATAKLERTRKNIQIQRPSRQTSFFDWFPCCSSNNNTNDGEIQVDNEQVLSMNSSEIRQEERRVINLKRVDLYVGPCKTKNLFSILDKGSHRHNFSLVENHY